MPESHRKLDPPSLEKSGTTKSELEMVSTKVINPSLLSSLTWPILIPLRAASLAYTAASEVVYVCDLGRHNLTNTWTALKAYYCDPGHTRPTWNLPFHLLLKTIKSNLEYPGHTLNKMRGSAEFLYEVTMPWSVRITPFRFHVNRPILLEPERQAARHSSLDSEFVIPEECSGSDEYELTGEWVEWKDKNEAADKCANKQDKVILFLHGGAFLCGSPKTHRSLVWRIAKETGARIFVLNYRLAPEHPFPAAIHDAFAAYLYLTNPGHPAFLKPGAFFSPNTPLHQPVSPQSIVVMGDSAGGGLSAAFLVYMKDFLKDKTGEAMFEPVRGGVLLSPWVELTCSTESWDSNYRTDYLPGRPNTVFHSMFPNDTESPLNPVYSYLFGLGDAGRKRTFITRSKRQCVCKSESTCDCGGDFKPIDMARRDSGIDVVLETEETLEDCNGPRNVLNVKRQLDEEEVVFRLAKHPLASPVYADCSGMPPILIQSGDAEMLRDESMLLAHRLALANPELHERGFMRLELYRDMPHVFQAFTFLHSAQTALKNISVFISSLFNSSQYDTAQGNHGVDSGIMAVDSFLYPPPYSQTATEPTMDVMEGVASMKASMKVVGAALGGAVVEDVQDAEGGWLVGDGMLHPFL
ncbi:hypothetical protein SpCBS45565_g04501 [Spizellomyces sp. 'palustris']|nr:hypothetical protein SpCBS45565_g04501 [Spizellomyces sp. 'palustris']